MRPGRVNSSGAAVVLALAMASIAAAQPGEAPPASAADVLHLTNGGIVPCRILQTSVTGLKIEYRIAHASAPISRDVTWSEVRRVDFAMDDEFRALGQTVNQARDGARLRERWAELAPLLSRPDHPAGELGLAIARLSLDGTDSGAKAEAIGVCRAIEQEDWSLIRRAQARLTHVRLLAALGRADEAAALARRLCDEATAPPEVAMAAGLFLAENDFVALRHLEEENPRWPEDDRVRPEREALFHRSLDAFLRPSLFDGSLAEVATDGLWGAVRLREFDRDLPAASDTARDLLALYPDSPRAADARAFLAKHRSPLTADEPSPAATAAADSHAPPSGDREPVVTRRARYEPGPGKPGRGRTAPAPTQEGHPQASG